jgi:hypothetical protein
LGSPGILFLLLPKVVKQMKYKKGDLVCWHDKYISREKERIMIITSANGGNPSHYAYTYLETGRKDKFLQYNYEKDTYNLLEK